MSEIKYSVLLDELMERALTVGDMPNPPFTAERFLVAIIDKLTKDPEEPFNEELHSLKMLVVDKFPEFSEIRPTLIDYICDEDTVPELDDLYMQKMLLDAKSSVIQHHGDQIDTIILMLCIINDPNVRIKRMLEEKEEEDAPFSSFDEILDEFFDLPEEPEKLTPDAVKAELAELITDVKRVRRELQDVIFGQDNAINVFTTGYFQSKMRALLGTVGSRPGATFLFAGPPGVGKTFMAEQAAKALELPFMRFDMSEYSDKEANIEFCGSDKVYKNGKPGNVTDFVAQNPKSVLLFDEIEKAHINVIYLFLQMLDAGRLRDNYTDEEVSFTDTIIILTTNAGRQLYEESQSADLSTLSRKVVIKALQTDKKSGSNVPYFPPAICSRFASGNVVMFNHVGAHNLYTIAQREIARQTENMQQQTGISVTVDPKVYTALLLAEGGAADARTVKGRAESFFHNELYELLRLIDSEKVKGQITQVEKITVDVDLKHADKEIADLFRTAQKTQVLLFAEPAVVSLCKDKVKNCEILGVQSKEEAVRMLKQQNVDLALLDMYCDTDCTELLNMEDAQSPARDFFKFLREHKSDLPVYLLERPGVSFGEEEKISFLRQGVRGTLRVAKGKCDFAESLAKIGAVLHQQASLEKMAKENKRISFETAQSVTKNGKNAAIRLFDFAMDVAVEAEDSKTVVSGISKPNVRFADVLGANDAKQELSYFVSYLKDPNQYIGTGVKAPRGVLLYGPPGTGKTMLAKAMACEAGVTFIATEGNRFLKSVVGEGSDYVHKLFRTARKYAPAILFIDEIDAIAKERRGSGSSEDVLTAFLTEMDGFAADPTKPVFVLAATNFDVEPGGPKSLDPALMRRFDRRVYIDLPNREDRTRFLNMKIAQNPALEITDELVESLALRSTGMSLAELDSAIELALRSAIIAGSTKVTDAIMEEAFEKFNGGEAKKWDVSLLERVARHEAGHAFLCWHSGTTPAYLTIVARGDHGGYMQHAEQEGKMLHTAEELLAKIRTSLGGRAAEILYYGQKDGISTGAGGDLAKATRLAQRFVCTYGMDEEFGLAVVDGAMSAEVRTVVNRILKEQMAEAIRLLRENKPAVDALVEALLSKNHMTKAQIEQTVAQTAVGNADRITTTT